MTLIYLVTAWVAGILIAYDRQTAWSIWLALGGVSLCVAWLFRARRPTRLALVVLAAFAFGIARQAWAQRPLPGAHIARYVGTGNQTFTGKIVHTPDVRDTHVNLTISVEHLETISGPIHINGLVLVQAPRYGGYAYGDRVRVQGELLTPPEFDTFSYRDYLARRGVYALVRYARIELLKRQDAPLWYQALYDLRERAHETIARLLPSPQAPLLSGILLGLDTELPAEVREAFNRTGTAHIIAISGANVIIVIRVLLNLLTPALGIRRARLLTMFGVAGYTLFVGADPTVMRAGIMGCLVMFAAQTGRKAHGLTSLAFAVWAMSVWNPGLLWDIGFQLSVAATAGLVLFGDVFTKGLEKLLTRLLSRHTARKVTSWLSEPVAVSLAAQTTTTPLAMLYFGQLSLVSLLANALIVPAQPWVMMLGWLALIAGLLAFPLGWLVSWAVWLPLTYTLEIARWLASFPWAAVEAHLSSSVVWGFYGLLFGLGWLKLQHPEDRTELWRRLRHQLSAISVLLTAFLVLAVVWYIALTQPDGRLHVWFLDVGHGHAVLLQTPRGAHILVDGGPNPSRLRQEIGDALPAWDRTLDLVIATQPVSSAIGALPALLENYEVALVATSAQESADSAYQTLTALLERKHISRTTLVAGQQIETGDGVHLEVLFSPPPSQPQAGAGEFGLVLKISYGSASFLVMPKLSAQAVETLLTSGHYLGSTVAVLPSHGSDAANPPTLLTAVSPQIAVVMAERDGFPATETLERLQQLGSVQLFRTDRQGTIEMVVEGDTLRVYPEDE